MLDRPNLYRMQKIYSSSLGQGTSGRRRPRLISISEAYRNLAQLISQRDVPLKLPLNKDREVIARLRKHSLQVAPESVYPSSSRRGSYRFLRASYTAGSMAGLGFSMVILGICIGIFLGFLLWKRRLGVIPYYLNPWQRPMEAEAASGMVPQSSTDIGLLHAHQYPTNQSLVSELPTFDNANDLTAPILVPNLSPTMNRRYWIINYRLRDYDWTSSAKIILPIPIHKRQSYENLHDFYWLKALFRVSSRLRE